MNAQKIACTMHQIMHHGAPGAGAQPVLLHHTTPSLYKRWCSGAKVRPEGAKNCGFKAKAQPVKIYTFKE